MLDVNIEILKIIDSIKEYVEDDEIVVIPVSGGIDFDVTARLCYRALGKERIKLFLIKEHNFEKKFILHAKKLAENLKVELTEIPFRGKSLELMKILEKADKDHIFHADSVLEEQCYTCQNCRNNIIEALRQINGTFDNEERTRILNQLIEANEDDCYQTFLSNLEREKDGKNQKKDIENFCKP